VALLRQTVKLCGADNPIPLCVWHSVEFSGMAGPISTAAPLKWEESPRSHKPFLGDLAVAMLPPGAAPILAATVRAMTSLPPPGA
jgi:hypothetical protein